MPTLTTTTTTRTHYRRPGWFTRNVFNRSTAFLTRRGLSVWGSRVLEVKIGGKPLDPGAIYRLATNEYMMAGGDGYAALTKGKPVLDASGGPLMANVVMDYITARGSVSPALEGRIVEQK